MPRALHFENLRVSGCPGMLIQFSAWLQSRKLLLILPELKGEYIWRLIVFFFRFAKSIRQILSSYIDHAFVICIVLLLQRAYTEFTDVLVVIVIDENQENSSIYTQLIKSHGARTSCHVKSLGSYRVQICINPLSTMYISLSCFQVKLLQYYTSKMIIYKRAGAHRNFSNLKAKLLEFQLYMSVLRSSDQKFKFRNFVLFLSCEIGNNMSTKLKWVTSEMAHLD